MAKLSPSISVLCDGFSDNFSPFSDEAFHIPLPLFSSASLKGAFPFSEKENFSSDSDADQKKKQQQQLLKKVGQAFAFAFPSGHAPVDWKETPRAHVFKVEVPGLKKEEVKVEMEEEGRVLKISGEKIAENKEEGVTWRCVEKSSGKFARKFNLLENAKIGEVQASLENGVLTVTVPKIEPKEVIVKSVEISG